jgi:hypothetical protein
MARRAYKGMVGAWQGIASVLGTSEKENKIKFRRFRHLGIMGVLRRMLGDVVKSFFSFG